MAIPTATEYAEVDGLPLRTTAWYTTSLAALYDSPAASGAGTAVAYRHGERPPTRWFAPKLVALPLFVVGDLDSDGNVYADVRTGLRRNLDELKNKLAPKLHGDFTVPLVHHHPDGDRSARCQVASPLATRAVGPSGMRAVVDLWLPDGVMRDTTATVVSGTSSLVVPNPGTDQFDATITITGSATAVTISSSGFGGWSWTFNGTLGVTVDTGKKTATRGGSPVHGLVSSSGAFGLWMPIARGGSTFTISPTGGTATVEVSHKVPWA